MGEMVGASGTPELLTGRVIAVTGASRGIGAAIARRAAEAGAEVVGVSRSGSAPEHERIVALTADVCDDDAPDRILDGALAAFGRLDALVNNAATIHHADCWEHSDEAWDEVFTTNLTAPFRLSQRAVVHWLDAAVPGVIVNITSIESEVSCPQQCSYASTKGGLLGLTRAMAVELSGRGIRVVCLAPGYTDTEAETVNPEGLDALIPVGRRARPDEIAGAAVFLLSDLASYATGTTLFVDGGYTAR
jgi:NAD(P)-dependent dehydrogenase (short-subunit alcohol dehydrogenase family)